MIYILNKDNKQIATHDMKFEDYFISLSQFLEEPKKYFEEWKEGYIATLYPPKSLGDYQNKAKTKLNQARAKRLEEPLTVSGITYDIDKDSKEMMNGFIVSGQIVRDLLQDNTYVHKTKWTDYYNVRHDVTDFDLKMVILQLAMRTDEIFTEFAEIKERIEGATTLEELDKITWVESTINTNF